MFAYISYIDLLSVNKFGVEVLTIFLIVWNKKEIPLYDINLFDANTLKNADINKIEMPTGTILISTGVLNDVTIQTQGNLQT